MRANFPPCGIGLGHVNRCIPVARMIVPKIQFKQVKCFLRVPAKFRPRSECVESLLSDAIRAYLDPNIGALPPLHARTRREQPACLFPNKTRMQVLDLLLLSMVMSLGIQKARLERPTQPYHSGKREFRNTHARRCCKMERVRGYDKEVLKHDGLENAAKTVVEKARK